MGLNIRGQPWSWRCHFRVRAEKCEERLVNRAGTAVEGTELSPPDNTLLAA